jgi:hypothetical protein
MRSSVDRLGGDLASQLEAWGLWEWAVYVLLHVEHPGTRTVQYIMTNESRTILRWWLVGFLFSGFDSKIYRDYPRHDPFSLVLRKEYFDCPQRDLNGVHYI